MHSNMHTDPDLMICVKIYAIVYLSSPFCRHKRVAIHPADRDEDEQERSASARKQQRGSGLISARSSDHLAILSTNLSLLFPLHPSYYGLPGPLYCAL